MMTLGDKNKKYCVPVDMVASASITVAEIYCDSAAEYDEIINKNIDDLFEEGYFNVNCHNNFDVSDGEIQEIKFDDVKDYYEIKRAK